MAPAMARSSAVAPKEFDGKITIYVVIKCGIIAATRWSYVRLRCWDLRFVCNLAYICIERWK